MREDGNQLATTETLENNIDWKKCEISIRREQYAGAALNQF